MSTGMDEQERRDFASPLPSARRGSADKSPGGAGGSCERPRSDYSSLHAEIAELDPLRASAAMRAIPWLNQRREVDELVRLLASIVPRREDIRLWRFAEVAAAMRDIGFFLGSLKRHGIEPVEVMPRLEPLLLEMGRRTGLPPRETLLHITVWNPAAPDRERLFTGLPTEVHLLASVRNSMTAVEAAIHGLVALYDVPLAAREFVPRCDEVAALLGKMVESIVYAYRNVSPRVFSDELRPYFEPIRVGGHSYIGPGAVEMPLFLVDHMLWGLRSENCAYLDFKETYTPYILPPLRALYWRFAGRPSLLERVLAEAEEGGASAERRAGLQALDRVFEVLLRFRAPHTNLAGRVYDDQKAAHAVGSGGYSPHMLDELLRLTRDARRRLTGWIAERRPVEVT